MRRHGHFQSKSRDVEVQQKLFSLPSLLYKPLHAVLDELVRGQALAKLRATAVDALMKPTVSVDADRLHAEQDQRETRD